MNSQKPSKINAKSKLNKVASKRRAQGLIISFFVIIFGITISCFSIMNIIEKTYLEQSVTGNTIIFYDADYDYNIFKDEDYLELDRNVRFANSQNGLTVEIVDGNLNDVPTDIRDSFVVINKFIDYAIAGNYERLNDLFSDEYFEADGEPKMEFTMQQLYNIKITYIADTATESNGYTYSSQDFWLEYMIRRNNGTFRNDMPSDCIKKEYVRITDRNGELEIDALVPYKTEVQRPQKLGSTEIISIICLTSIVIVAVTAVCIVINRKFRV